MLNLFRTELAREFLTLNRDEFIRLTFTGAHKTHFKAETETEAYGKALCELGFDKVFAIENPIELAEAYVVTLVNSNNPLCDAEMRILENASTQVKELVTGSARPIAPATMIADHNMVEDKHLKVIYAAKYIAKTFCNMTNWYSKFVAGKISGDELVVHLREFIESTYDIIVDDTNVAYNIPRTLSAKHRIKVYIPTTVDLTVTTPTDFMLNEIILELNDSSNYCLHSALYKKIINIFTTNRNIYSFYEDVTSSYTIFEADMYARKYMLDSIKSLLAPTFTLGEPMTLSDTITKVIAYGNYDSTVTLYFNNHAVIIDKDSFGMAKKALQNYKVCSMNKAAGVIKNDEKVLLWHCIFSNAKPIDGNYNNITKKNVQ